MNKVKITLHPREHFGNEFEKKIGKIVVGKFEPKFERECWSWQIFNSIERIIGVGRESLGSLSLKSSSLMERRELRPAMDAMRF